MAFGRRSAGAGRSASARCAGCGRSAQSPAALALGAAVLRRHPCARTHQPRRPRPLPPPSRPQLSALQLGVRTLPLNAHQGLVLVLTTRLLPLTLATFLSGPPVLARLLPVGPPSLAGRPGFLHPAHFLQFARPIPRHRPRQFFVARPCSGHRSLDEILAVFCLCPRLRRFSLSALTPAHCVLLPVFLGVAPFLVVVFFFPGAQI